MFKIIKDNKIIGVSENEPVLLDNYAVQEDTEHSVSDYLQVNGEYVLTSSAEAIEQKKADVRAVRNQYLEQTDKFLIADYPISDEERELYKQYREYLRTYPECQDWYKSNPKKFEEWEMTMTDQVSNSDTNNESTEDTPSTDQSKSNTSVTTKEVDDKSQYELEL